MGKNRHQRPSGRRDANVVSSRFSPSRLHARPSPSVPDYTRDLIGRVQVPPSQTPRIADNRVWRPVQFRQTVFGYSGAPSGGTRLQDAPRPFKTGIAASGPVSKKAQARRAQVNRWGPNLDRQTKAVQVFAPSPPLCRQRQVRKEVIHAKGIAGSKVRRPRRRPSSGISC